MSLIKQDEVLDFLYAFLCNPRKHSVSYEVASEFYGKKYVCRFPLGSVEGVPVQQAVIGETDGSFPVSTKNLGLWFPKQKVLAYQNILETGVEISFSSEDAPSWLTTVGQQASLAVKELEHQTEDEFRKEYPTLHAVEAAFDIEPYEFDLGWRDKALSSIIDDKNLTFAERLHAHKFFSSGIDEIVLAAWQISRNSKKKLEHLASVMQKNDKKIAEELWKSYADAQARKDLCNNPSNSSVMSLLAIHHAVARHQFDDAKSFHVNMVAHKKDESGAAVIERTVSAGYIKKLKDALWSSRFPNGSTFKDVPPEDILSIKYRNDVVYERLKI